MSEQPVDIFEYHPITEWNDQLVDFGMSSTDGDVRLTEICLAAESCLEATKNAMALSYTSTSFIKARSSPVLKIIRTLFGEDTGITIKTFTQLTEDGAIHYMSPMVSAEVSIYEKDWIIDTIDTQSLGLRSTLLPDTYTGYPVGEKVISNSTWHQKQALNPLAVAASGSVSPSVIAYGNRPVTGNWATDGEPYFEIEWEHISINHCTDNISITEGACLSSVVGGFCRQTDYNEPLIVSNNHTAGCSDPQYETKTTCNNGGETWTVYQIPYSSKEITFPASTSSDILLPLKENFCIGNTSGSWANGGKCYYTRDTFSGGAGNNWYDVNANTSWNFATKTTCMETSQNYSAWNDYYLMWIEQPNTWTNIYGVWRPSYDSAGPPPIAGTADSHKHYNISTANNHRKWPSHHAPPQTGTTKRFYHSDTNSSWGNGYEVGRSTIPIWVTNTFEWPDNDNTYDYCMSGSTHIEQWSSPLGYNDAYACEAAGTCTGEVSPGSYHNDEAACESHFLCSNHAWDYSESACLYNEHCCSGGGWGSAGSQWADNTCLSAGTCHPNGAFNNRPGTCYAHYGASYTWHGYYWGSNADGNYCGQSWYQANTFTSDNYSWDSIVPDIEVEMNIPAEYYWGPQFPAHTFVDTTQGQVLLLQGYATGSGTQPDFSKIRWAPPEYNTPDYNRTYPRPTKFRIYRAPYWYLDLTAFTDFHASMWKLAGEVITKNDAGYHFFYDSREDMMTEGLNEFQGAYYGVTAVWEDWNWKRGYTIKYYDDMSGPGPSNRGGCQKWDVYHGQTWSHYTNNYRVDGGCSNNNYTTQETCEGNGACLPSNTHSQWHNDEVGCLANGGTWSSANYTWTAGSWSGTPNSSASLDNVENATPVAGWPQLAKAVRYTAASNYRTYRASGYFKAPVSGEYQFEVGGDDGLFMWLGANQQSVSGLIGTRNTTNYLTAVPGLHGVVYHVGTITLVKDGIYPLLAYGGNHTGGFRFQIRIHYPDGDWNNGGNGSGEWKYVPILMGPEDMVLEDGGGQTVEGQYSSTSVYAWYTDI